MHKTYYIDSFPYPLNSHVVCRIKVEVTQDSNKLESCVEEQQHNPKDIQKKKRTPRIHHDDHTNRNSKVLCIKLSIPEHKKRSNVQWCGKWTESFIEEMTCRGGCQLSLNEFLRILSTACETSFSNNKCTEDVYDKKLKITDASKNLDVKLSLLTASQLGLSLSEKSCNNNDEILENEPSKLYFILSWRQKHSLPTLYYPLPLTKKLKKKKNHDTTSCRGRYEKTHYYSPNLLSQNYSNESLKRLSFDDEEEEQKNQKTNLKRQLSTDNQLERLRRRVRDLRIAVERNLGTNELTCRYGKKDDTKSQGIMMYHEPLLEKRWNSSTSPSLHYTWKKQSENPFKAKQRCKLTPLEYAPSSASSFLPKDKKNLYKLRNSENFRPRTTDLTPSFHKTRTHRSISPERHHYYQENILKQKPLLMMKKKDRSSKRSSSSASSIEQRGRHTSPKFYKSPPSLLSFNNKKRHDNSSPFERRRSSLSSHSRRSLNDDHYFNTTPPSYHKQHSSRKNSSSVHNNNNNKPRSSSFNSSYSSLSAPIFPRRVNLTSMSLISRSSSKRSYSVLSNSSICSRQSIQSRKDEIEQELWERIKLLQSDIKGHCSPNNKKTLQSLSPLTSSFKQNKQSSIKKSYKLNDNYHREDILNNNDDDNESTTFEFISERLMALRSVLAVNSQSNPI